MSENKSVEIKEGESLTDSQKEQMELMSSQETPKTEVEFGDAVKGKVVSISKDSVFVDISLRNEAILAKSEVTDKDGKVTVAEGDEVELYVIAVKSDEVTLSKSN